jgi:predicted phage terminase large subunit-like protein
LIQTRWHQDDLAGRILADAEQGEHWDVISLPAIAEEDDPLGRDPGAALWPERFSEEALDLIRRSVGSYFWAAMYQQSPVPIGGEIFKQEWFRYADSVPENADRVVRYWDKAATAGGGDFSCGVLILSHDGRFFVADVIRGQWSPHRRNQVIEATTTADGERFGKRQLQIFVEQEPGSGGKESALLTIRQLAGYRVKADRPTGDKSTRALPLAAQFEAGNVFLVRAPWNRSFMDELCTYPHGRHDDQVDAAAGAFAQAAKKRRPFYCIVSHPKPVPIPPHLEPFFNRRNLSTLGQGMRLPRYD